MLLFGCYCFVVFPGERVFSVLCLLLVVCAPLGETNRIANSFVLLVFFVFVGPGTSRALLATITLGGGDPMCYHDLCSSGALPTPSSRRPQQSHEFPTP